MRMIDDDNYIAGRITKDKDLKKIIKKNKELLELERNLILSKRVIQNAKRRD